MYDDNYGDDNHDCGDDYADKNVDEIAYDGKNNTNDNDGVDNYNSDDRDESESVHATYFLSTCPRYHYSSTDSLVYRILCKFMCQQRDWEPVWALGSEEQF